MAEIQRGSAVVWGISTSAATYTGVVAGTQQMQAQSYSREADTDETRNSAGETVNVTHYNFTKNVTITVVPSSTTMIAAKAANIVPEPGQEVKVIDTDLNIGASSPGLSYMCVSATMNKTNTSKATIEMTLRRFDSISNYAGIAT